jgi:carbonic anhydrase
MTKPNLTCLAPSSSMLTFSGFASIRPLVPPLLFHRFAPARSAGLGLTCLLMLCASALAAAAEPPNMPARPEHPSASRQYIRARAAALAGHEAPAASGAHGTTDTTKAHWSYVGDTGPQAWGDMAPAFKACANGNRQSPINIEAASTVPGPAEPLHFNYQPSGGTVVNNGHTIQVDLAGDNAISVLGSRYQLLQIHFHLPSEEQLNQRGFAMVAHLVHKNAEGQLAVVAVLLDPGAANPLVNKVWAHMPRGNGERVRLSADLLDLNELLPADPSYYSFMGSLTTPPCTENVLWLVMKTPMPVSREQIKLFAQLFPNNARPVQALNGRAVRDAH